MRSRYLILVAVGCALDWPAVSGWLTETFAQDAKAQSAPAEGIQLPRPDPAFKGNIGESYKDSTPDYPLPVKAPKGSPNVLVILLDDVGFGMCSTFGGPSSEPHVPVGWAWAMDAPFQWTKQVASHFGGTRNPLIVHWAKGQTRTQFHHVIDVVPTILEACNIPEPKVVNGIPQKPIEGVSMLYSFDDATAKGRRTTQYFEMKCNRAIYHEGWVACSRFGAPWDRGKGGDDFTKAPWELYNVEEDFSQANDLAAKNPEKLKELQGKFVAEARKYGVFPLDPRFSERMDPKLRVAGEPPTSWTYYGNNVLLPEPVGPQLFPRSHTITADVVIPRGGADGVVTCAGASSAGWSLYVKNGKPNFRYTFFDIANVNIPDTTVLPEGKVTLKTEFTPDGSKEGGGTLKLFVNGQPAGEGKLKRSAFRHRLEPFEIGRDSITPIDPAYKDKGKFEFAGTIEKVAFELTKK